MYIEKSMGNRKKCIQVAVQLFKDMIDSFVNDVYESNKQ